MAIAIIVWNDENLELLRFTETKLFFNAKNNGIDFFTDCFIVKNEQDIVEIENIVNAWIRKNNTTVIEHMEQQKAKDLYIKKNEK